MYRELTAALDICVAKWQWHISGQSLLVSFERRHMKPSSNEDDHLRNSGSLLVRHLQLTNREL